MSTTISRLRRPVRGLSMVLGIVALLGVCALFLSAGERGTPASRRSKEAGGPFRHYYVAPGGSDVNEGSSARPWKTITWAAAHVRPGAVVHVRPGTYVSGGEIKTNVSGTPTARVIFISDRQWTAKLLSTATGNMAVWNNAGSYVDIRGFEISGRGGLGIYNKGSFVAIAGNLIHDIPATGCPTAGGAGIINVGPDAADDDIIGNVVHDIGDYDHPCPRVHGIYHANARGHISDNVVYRNQGFGIHLWGHATNAVVSNNTVFNNAYGGILIGAGDGGLSNDYTVVTNNIVYRNGRVSGADGDGIREYGSAGIHNRYLNNLVYENLPAEFRLLPGKTHSGTVTADPQFVDYQPDGSGDYRLQLRSPARGNGIVVNAPPNVRVVPPCDIGASGIAAVHHVLH